MGHGFAHRAGPVPTIDAVVFAVLFAVLPEGLAFAHSIGLSNGDYRLEGRALSADLSMSQRELIMLLPELDTDHDGELAADELAAGSGALTRAIVGGLTVTADGAPCTGALDRALPLEGEAGVVVRAHYTCPHGPSRLSLAWPMFAALTPGHRQVARVGAAGRSESRLLDRAHAEWTLDLADHRPGASGLGLAWSMLKLGFEHILTGADHLIFLLGLIIVGGSPRAFVGVITAFTLAHSITLALAAFDIFAPSPRIVEPLIALSIAYVGIENFLVKNASGRWRITFPFGLVHGFGFAGALREIALPHRQIPLALVSFNLGVELGQLGVLAIALPITLAARRAPRFGDRGVKVVSSAIAVTGVVLFVQRLIAS